MFQTRRMEFFSTQKLKYVSFAFAKINSKHFSLKKTNWYF